MPRSGWLPMISGLLVMEMELILAFAIYTQSATLHTH